MPGAPNLWCGGGDLSPIFLLFHWEIKLIWSFPLEGHKDLCDKVGRDGQDLDTAVESRSASLPTPLSSSEQHLPSLPILRESQGPWNQVRCNTLSSSGFLCSEHPCCRKGKQATPQMQESVTLETLKLLCHFAVYPVLMTTVLESGIWDKMWTMTRVTLTCTPSTQDSTKLWDVLSTALKWSCFKLIESTFPPMGVPRIPRIQDTMNPRSFSMHGIVQSPFVFLTIGFK